MPRRPQTAPLRPTTPGAFGKQIESRKRTPGSIRFCQSKAKSALDWVIHNSKQTPGPGEYSLDYPRPKTGRFSVARPKGYLDWVELRAKEIPAPDAYTLPGLGSASGRPGGKFSEARPKSYIEMEEYRAKQLPSPAEYRPKLLRKHHPAKFNESRPKSHVDWVVYFSKQLPSPNQYKIHGKTRYNASSEVAPGGRFTSSKRPSFIDLELHRVSDHPSPCDYNVTGYRATATRRPQTSYCPRGSLMDQIMSLDNMTRRGRRSRGAKARKQQIGRNHGLRPVTSPISRSNHQSI